MNWLWMKSIWVTNPAGWASLLHQGIKEGNNSTCSTRHSRRICSRTFYARGRWVEGPTEIAVSLSAVLHNRILSGCHYHGSGGCTVHTGAATGVPVVMEMGGGADRLVHSAPSDGGNGGTCGRQIHPGDQQSCFSTLTSLLTKADFNCYSVAFLWSGIGFGSRHDMPRK